MPAGVLHQLFSAFVPHVDTAFVDAVSTTSCSSPVPRGDHGIISSVPLLNEIFMNWCSSSSSAQPGSGRIPSAQPGSGRIFPLIKQKHKHPLTSFCCSYGGNRCSTTAADCKDKGGTYEADKSDCDPC